MYSGALLQAVGAPQQTPLSDWLATQRAQAAQQGLYDPATGLPTSQGLLQAGRQYAGALVAGSTAPEFRALPGLRTAGITAGAEDRISTRIPTAQRAEYPSGDPHKTADYSIDTASSRAAEEAHANNAAAMRSDDFPDLPVKGIRSSDRIVDTAQSHMIENLKWLHQQMVDKFGQAAVDRMAQWYDGANAVAHRWAEEYGYQPRQVAAAIANMSPQKEWNQNANLAGRMLGILRDQRNAATTPEMNDWAKGYLDQVRAEADNPKKQAAADELAMGVNAIRNRRFNEINDPETRALWLRAYDEAHNPRDYPLVTPEGDFGETALTDKGVPQKVAWGSFKEIEKAMRVLEGDGSLEAISRSLGGNHKVRSFYNNIIAPMHGDDVTIDTHAIAAAHLRPLSGNDVPVELGLGLKGSKSAFTGTKGNYGYYADAYRRAAEDLKLLPRQLQSITWEGVRGLFSPELKRDTSFWNQNWYLWDAYKHGRTPDADQVRQSVLNHAGGIDAPPWLPQPKIAPEAPTE